MSTETSPSAAAASAETLRVCGKCGIIAPSDRDACRDCDAPFGKTAPTVPRLVDEDMYWVGVRAQIVCRICGMRSPMNHLDTDGAVSCDNCGIDQAFDTNQWSRLLAHAHAVGDLAGPPPAGRFGDSDPSIAGINPFAAIGTKDTWAFFDREGKRRGDVRNQSLSVCAAPGHPLCQGCRAPLALTAQTDTSITVRCEPCDASATYETPKRVREQLEGVVALGQAEGDRDVLLDEDPGGAVAIRCPECRAPLDVDVTSTLARCPFCQVSSRIAPAARRVGASRGEPQTFWILFAGPSNLRKSLAGNARALASARAKKQKKRKNDAAERQREGRSSGGPRRARDEGASPPPTERARGPVPPELRRFLVMVLIVAAVFSYFWLRRQG